jgi:RecA-family ATPase
MIGFRFAGEPETDPRPNGHASPASRQKPGQEPVSPLDWPSLDGREPPAREFVVEDWLPTGVATSLYAPGGSGKSMLAQQLGACMAGGRDFLGLRTMKAPALGVFCEDDDEELWRRQCRINAAFSIRMAELAPFAAQGRLGMSNQLMTFPNGRPPLPLQLLADIEAKAREIGAKLVILDNAAQLFGGEENARADVTPFVNALSGLARRLRAAVLLLGHPPKNGAEYSGSTAWHAAVRCMWTMERLVEKGEDAEEEPTEQLALVRVKANYAPGREEIRLRWADGVLRRDYGDAPISGMNAAFHRHNARAAFLEALDALTGQGRNVSHSERASNYAPKAMKSAGLAVDFTKADLKRAMNNLFADGVIVANAKLWTGADRKPVLGIARRGAGRSEGTEP